MAEHHSGTLPLCTFGLVRQEECHKTVYTRHIGFRDHSDLSDADFELLCLRTEHADNLQKSAVNICFHHEQVLLQRFNQMQKYCCDPFNKHSSKVIKSLRAVTIEKAKQLTIASGKHIKPGEKLCTKCRKADTLHQAVGDEIHDEPSANDTDSSDLDMHLSQLNDSMTGIGCTPVKLHGLTVRSRVSYAKRKIDTATAQIQKKVSKVVDIPLEEVLHRGENENTECDGCSDLTRLACLTTYLLTPNSRETLS